MLKNQSSVRFTNDNEIITYNKALEIERVPAVTYEQSSLLTGIR